MRHYLILLILSLVSAAASAQSGSRTVEGTVADAKTRKGISYVTCKALNASDSLLYYAMTGADGHFRLTVDDRVKNVEFSLMGYRTQRMPVTAMGQKSVIHLRQDGITLKEVTVKAKPVTLHEDTINYNVAALKGKEDRYIEDVLKKIPGIEVSENGSIRYNGESINQLKIEGQDLLGNRYNQATRNLPAEAVATVQVMENDQPLKALKNKVPSNRATLNIKLKSGYRVRPFGELKGSAGGGHGTIWDNSLTLINVARRNQILLTAKMNNSGTDLSENTREHIDATDIYAYEPEPASLISRPDGGSVPINRSRYLKNKSYSLGLNHIRRIGQDGSLRTNIAFYGTSDTPSDTAYSLYGGQTQAALAESNRYRMREYTLQPQFRYELNATKVYLVNELRGSLSFSSGLNAMLTNGTGLGVYASSHPAYVQNRLRMYVNTSSNSYSVSSITRFFRRRELLDVTDTTSTSQGGYTLLERTMLTRFTTKNTVSTGFSLFGNNFDLEYGLYYLNDRISIDREQKDMTSRLKNSLTATYRVGSQVSYLSIELPLNVMTASVPWSTDGGGTEVYLSPSLSWRHEFSPMWKLRLSGGFSRDADGSLMTSLPYYSSYRTRRQTLDDIGWTRSKRIAMTLNHNDLIRLFSWQTMLSASWLRTDHYYEYSYGQDFTTVKPVWGDTRQRLFTALTSVDKTFMSIGFSMKGTLTYNRSEAMAAQNGLHRTVKSNITSAVLNLRWNKLTWLSLSDAVTYNINWQDRENKTDSRNTLHSLFNTAKAYLYPVRNISMNLSWELGRVELSQGEYAVNNFLDASLRWTVLKRIELTATMNNLFNRSRYEEASFDGLNYSYYAVPLRGREVLFGLSVKF